MRNKGKSGGNGDRQRWQFAEARGRKIYEMRERERCALERGSLMK